MNERLVAAFQRLKATGQTPWRPVGKPALVATLLTTAAICAIAHREGRWVPILDDANLIFHEAGHPIFGLLSHRLMVYGGTLGQCCMPSAVAGQFWVNRATCSFALSVIWFCENLWNIDRYMADARAQVLPLVGGGEHDWTEIFSRWGVLNRDVSIAHGLHGIAAIGIAATCLWLWRRR